MILKRKALIDFRNWLREKYDIRYWEFEEMPDAGKLGYYIHFFKDNVKSDWQYVEDMGNIYNNNHEKES